MKKLPQCTFKKSGTGVNTRLVTITKPSTLDEETGSFNLSKFFPKKEPKVTRIEDLLKAQAAEPPIPKPEAPKRGPQTLTTFFGKPINVRKFPEGTGAPTNLPNPPTGGAKQPATPSDPNPIKSTKIQKDYEYFKYKAIEDRTGELKEEFKELKSEAKMKKLGRRVLILGVFLFLSGLADFFNLPHDKEITLIYIGTLFVSFSIAIFVFAIYTEHKSKEKNSSK